MDICLIVCSKVKTLVIFCGSKSLDNNSIATGVWNKVESKQKNKLVQETRESVLKLLSPDQTERLSAGIPGLRPPPPNTTTPNMYENVGKPNNPEGAKKAPPGAAAGDQAAPKTPGTVE